MVENENYFGIFFPFRVFMSFFWRGAHPSIFLETKIILEVGLYKPYVILVTIFLKKYKIS
jgi:hypothetical protein